MATRISSIFPFLLATLLCVAGVELFYLGVERYFFDTGKVEQEVITKTVGSATGISKTTKKIDYSIIVSRNLFGTSSKNKDGIDSEPAPVEEQLESTTLDVVLMGTIGGGENGGRAIILNKSDRKQELYKVGDTVQGALVKDILRGKVILTVDGRNEMLDMSESRKYAQNSSQPVAARPSGIRRNKVVAPLVNNGEVSEVGQSVKPRVVRPTRRIVRPRPAAVNEDVPPESETTEEEFAPELEEGERE